MIERHFTIISILILAFTTMLSVLISDVRTRNPLPNAAAEHIRW